MEDLIRKYALENAISFKGTAQPGAIIGKLIAEDPSVKERMKDISPIIQKIIKEVNALSPEEQEKALLKINPEYFKNKKEQQQQRKEERSSLPPLKNAEKGKVITRIPPEPSKYAHVGHAVSFLINYLYAKEYEGKCILRFEDTNPEKASQEYVDAIKEDVLEYLDISPDETIIVSEAMEDYITYAEQLIKEEKAYTCNDKQEDISSQRRNMQPSPDRDKSVEEVQKEWEEMKSGTVEEGTRTLRLKIDPAHKNAVMRDPVIFRCSYKEHYKQKKKYNVWPMYDFENAVEDGREKITHVLRSNEFESRIELQDHIRSLFSLPNPLIKQYARFNIIGTTTQGREIRKGIENNTYTDWDDPQLVTLRALKRKGIVKETLYELSKRLGLSKTPSEIDFSLIASINRSILDKEAKRYFFIEKPKKIEVNNAPKQALKLKTHPESTKATRSFNTKDQFFIEEADLKAIKEGEVVRLMDCLNMKKEGNTFQFIDTDVATFRKQGKKIIHWLPAEETIKTSIRKEKETVEGLAETTLAKEKEHAIIQFERYGFARIDKQGDPVQCWFAHK